MSKKEIRWQVGDGVVHTIPVGARVTFKNGDGRVAVRYSKFMDGVSVVRSFAGGGASFHNFETETKVEKSGRECSDCGHRRAISEFNGVSTVCRKCKFKMTCIGGIP